jgi:hypothetical protein
MQSDEAHTAGETETETKAEDAATPAATTRAEAYRERFRKAQAIAAQVARARAAGGKPSEEEAARLVAQFHARGGQVTVCPPAEEATPGEQDRSKAARPPSG